MLTPVYTCSIHHKADRAKALGSIHFTYISVLALGSRRRPYSIEGKDHQGQPSFQDGAIATAVLALQPLRADKADISKATRKEASAMLQSYRKTESAQ